MARISGGNVAALAATLSMVLTLTSCDKPATAPSHSNTPAAPPSFYDTPIDFGTAGTSASIKGSGWSKPEEQFTWTEGNTATLVIPVSPTDAQVTLRMRLSGMIKEPEFPTHPVEVYVNDQKIADWQVGNTAPFSTPIPKELTKAGGRLAFTLKMPKAVSPKDLGKGEDPRALGICVFDLELSTK